MTQQQTKNVALVVTDEEFTKAMEKILREDIGLLEKLAKI